MSGCYIEALDSLACIAHQCTLGFPLLGIDAIFGGVRTGVSNTVLLSPFWYNLGSSEQMIDWVTAIIPFVHEPLNGGSVLKVLPSGEVEWESPCRLSVRGSHERDIAVRSQGGDGSGLATELVIDGNPSKYLQGHNIFGSDDLRVLVSDTLTSVSSLLKFSVPEDVLRAVRAGEYRLTRVDINYMFELPTMSDVKSWIRAAEFKSKTRHGRPSSKAGSLYWGKSSRRWSLKAYSKGEELKAGKSHALPDHLSGTPLINYAQNKLRLELTLRAKELEKIGLLEAKRWQGSSPFRLFSEYAKRIEMNEQIALTTKVLHDLPRYLQGTYVLWQTGQNPRELLSKNTFYKHRKALLELGIDINLGVEKVDRSNVVPLIRVLEAVPVDIPGWAYDMGLVHPSAQRVVKHA